MRTKILAASLILVAFTAVLAGGDDARAVIDKAIAATGGEAKLARFNAATFKEKGTYYGMGDGLPYSSNFVMQMPDRFKMEIVGVFTLCLDGDKGWIEANGEVKDMPKEELEVQQTNHKAGWIASLLPLKDKAFTLKLLPAAKVDGKEARVVQVNRKDYPEVKLYFDAANNLLVKSEFKSKASEQGYKEVMMENTFANYKDVEGAKLAHKMSIRRDGKLFVEGEIESITPEPKLDPKVFAKPK